MLIDLTAAEIARLCRLVHLANDAADAALWEKLKAAHTAQVEWAATVAHLTERIESAPNMAAFEALEREYGKLLQQALATAPKGVPFHDEHLERTAAAMRTSYHRLAPPIPLADPMTGHVIEPMPVQTSVSGLADALVQNAVAAVVKRFHLRDAQQRRLSRATQYTAVVNAALHKDWPRVERLLGYARVIE